ncbi:MAG TPA: DUF4190 domain-containing protein [Pyrinomonadaceae bacterium]|jgi:hypothetical protein
MNNETQDYVVLGQKYAYATISLVLGISCFVSLLGLEKAILAIVFGWLALRATPAPKLKEHRSWAKAGMILGILPFIILPIIIFLNFDRLREFVELLEKMNGGR